MRDLTGVFAKPFAQQVAAFRIRLADLRDTTSWKDVWQTEHDRAFMVAGAQKAELLADLAAAVDKAITKGTSLEEFRRDFAKAVEDHNWHGWTGETTEKGRAWRTRVIYRTNLSVSYAAGRYAQLKEAGFTHWVYLHGNSREPRLQHLGWDGLILPADHPFWETHYPPNGWGCSCHVAGARSERGAVRLGGKPEVTLDDGWATPLPKTGAPPGIGKGWGYAPGASASELISTVARKLDALPPQISKDLVQSAIKEQIFANWLNKPEGNFPLAMVSATDAEALAAKTRVVQMTPNTAEKQVKVHPEMTSAEYVAVQEIIDNATTKEVQTNVKSGTLSLVYILDQSGPNGGGYVFVVKATKSGESLLVTSFRRLSRDDALRDKAISKILDKGGTYQPPEKK